MSNRNPGNDRGNVLFLTIGAMALIAIAMILSVRAFSLRMEASQRETRAVEQRLVGSVAESIVNEWMADSEWSDYILNYDYEVGWPWMTPLGKPCPNPNPTPPQKTPETMCWRISDVNNPFDTTNLNTNEKEDIETLVTLRGKEAQRQARDITIEVAVGCYTNDPEDCQQITTTTRHYERAVLFQYQLHYDTNEVPEGAKKEANDALTAVRQQLINDGVALDGIDAELLRLHPRPVERNDLLTNSLTEIVFTGEDDFNGPVRTSLDHVVICGDPDFHKHIELGLPVGTDTTNEEDPDSDPATNDGLIRPPTGSGCTNSPKWHGQPTGQRVEAGGALKLPPITPEGRDPTLECDEVNYSYVSGVVGGSCKTPSRALRNDDVIVPDSGSNITIKELVVKGSVTVFAEGDITVCGDIQADTPPDAISPSVIALIANGNIVLDRGDPALGCGGDTLTGPLSDPQHNLNLINVAVLAPKGAIYARNWHLACNGSCPKLTITGSIAAKHLGLYGIPDDSGIIKAGWSKQFSYPSGFWMARPPWWPGFEGKEWEAQ